MTFPAAASIGQYFLECMHKVDDLLLMFLNLFIACLSLVGITIIYPVGTLRNQKDVAQFAVWLIPKQKPNFKNLVKVVYLLSDSAVT